MREITGLLKHTDLPWPSLTFLFGLKALSTKKTAMMKGKVQQLHCSRTFSHQWSPGHQESQQLLSWQGTWWPLNYVEWHQHKPKLRSSPHWTSLRYSHIWESEVRTLTWVYIIWFSAFLDFPIPSDSGWIICLTKPPTPPLPPLFSPSVSGNIGQHFHYQFIIPPPKREHLPGVTK